MYKFNLKTSKNFVTDSYNTALIMYEDGTLSKRDYQRNIDRISNGYEPLKSKGGIGRRSADSTKPVRHDNLRRTQKLMMDYVRNNPPWYSFITLTFADNITDLTYANKRYNFYTMQIKRKYSEFKCIGTAEFQKRGAVHYHLLTNLIPGTDLLPLRDPPKKLWNPINKYYTYLSYYDLPYWNDGFSSGLDLSICDKEFKPELYMLKYLYKDLDKRLAGTTKLLKTNNLKKPLKILYNRKDPAFDDLEKILKAFEFQRKMIYPKREYAVPFTDISYGTEVTPAYTEILSHLPSNVIVDD